jgi:hypothetical protein
MTDDPSQRPSTEELIERSALGPWEVIRAAADLIAERASKTVAGLWSHDERCVWSDVSAELFRGKVVCVVVDFEEELRDYVAYLRCARGTPDVRY